MRVKGNCYTHAMPRWHLVANGGFDEWQLLHPLLPGAISKPHGADKLLAMFRWQLLGRTEEHNLRKLPNGWLLPKSFCQLACACIRAMPRGQVQQRDGQ